MGGKISPVDYLEYSPFKSLHRNEIILFMLWVNLQLYRGEFKKMPQTEKNLIKKAVSNMGLDFFNQQLSAAVRKVTDLLVEFINRGTLEKQRFQPPKEFM
jgi:hypothetical protein